MRTKRTTNFLHEKKQAINNEHYFMEKLTLYLRESYQELVKNVSWPTVAQLQESTVVVLVTSGLLALIVFVMDVLCSLTFKSIYDVL